MRLSYWNLTPPYVLTPLKPCTVTAYIKTAARCPSWRYAAFHEAGGRAYCICWWAVSASATLCFAAAIHRSACVFFFFIVTWKCNNRTFNFTTNEGHNQQMTYSAKIVLLLLKDKFLCTEGLRCHPKTVKNTPASPTAAPVNVFLHYHEHTRWFILSLSHIQCPAAVNIQQSAKCAAQLQSLTDA